VKFRCRWSHLRDGFEWDRRWSRDSRTKAISATSWATFTRPRDKSPPFQVFQPFVTPHGVSHRGQLQLWASWTSGDPGHCLSFTSISEYQARGKWEGRRKTETRHNESVIPAISQGKKKKKQHRHLQSQAPFPWLDKTLSLQADKIWAHSSCQQ